MSESESSVVRSASEPVDLVKTRKKGKRRAEDYKRTVLKKARTSGQSYTTQKGKVIPQKNQDNVDDVRNW